MSATDETPGGSGAASADTDATPSAYQEVQRSPEFASLRKRWRGFIFTMSAVFLAWFLVYVLLSDFAHGVVDTRLGSTNFTVGLLLGLLQFVSTFAIATIYVRFANRNLDDDAEALRRRVEEKL
ncbi:uncharacterized membrane protein (DUF485 family) [Actinomycetospora succinea]|uniref:Uncharacterized membrane protein (DUF485 family) n=1 Tax=Actinomycetospora succinea TaxID=663603 RepID=A0A4R6VHK0_9PSEU|nr:DUF485 domain-containing protein [Actinomycetospora succinea]TDQ60814.1 uncharacterized membrane protein (DUF485 family) [Actinomycetospora succinea]